MEKERVFYVTKHLYDHGDSLISVSAFEIEMWDDETNRAPMTDLQARRSSHEGISLVEKMLKHALFRR